MADNHNSINIDIDTSGIDRATEYLRHIKGGVQTAIKNAMNTAVTGIRTDAGRKTSKVFAVDDATVKKRMWVTKATDRNLSAEVGRRGPRFFARNFPRDPNTMPGRRGGRAVFLRPRRDGGGWLLNADTEIGKHGVSKAFVATLPSRGRGVFRRIGNYRNRLTHARGLSVPEMLGDAEVRGTVEANAAKRFNEELDRQVRLLLKKNGGSE